LNVLVEVLDAQADAIESEAREQLQRAVIGAARVDLDGLVARRIIGEL
jgi:hypothetical protein